MSERTTYDYELGELRSNDPNGANKIVWWVAGIAVTMALSVLVTLVGWTSTNVIDLKTQVAVLNQKVDTLITQRPVVP